MSKDQNFMDEVRALTAMTPEELPDDFILAIPTEDPKYAAWYVRKVRRAEQSH